MPLLESIRCCLVEGTARFRVNVNIRILYAAKRAKTYPIDPKGTPTPKVFFYFT